MPLTGFEPRTSVERSDCCATVLRTVCIAPFKRTALSINDALNTRRPIIERDIPKESFKAV